MAKKKVRALAAALAAALAVVQVIAPHQVIAPRQATLPRQVMKTKIVSEVAGFTPTVKNFTLRVNEKILLFRCLFHLS